MVSVSQAVRLLIGEQNPQLVGDPAVTGLRLSFERAQWLPISPPELYAELRAFLLRVEAQLEKGQGFKPQEGARLLRQLLHYPSHYLTELHMLTMRPRGEVDSFASHSLHVAINAFLLARALGMTERQQMETALAGLFHELGMIRLPAALRGKADELSGEEVRQIQSHPAIGSAIVSGFGEPWHNIALIILQEHERLDGSGYPFGIRDSAILPGASVVGVVDYYEALVNNRPYRSRLTPAEAAIHLLKNGKQQFPAEVIKEFLNLFSIYPVNSHVRLNNGAVCQVTRTNPAAPLKPVVRLVEDGQGKPASGGGRLIDLSRTPLLHIAEILGERHGS